MLAPKTLADIQRRIQHLEERRKLAQVRLDQTTGKYWYFALVGFTTTSQSLQFDPVAHIQAVTHPPGEVFLASALSKPSLLSAVGRYSHHVTHELAVNRDLGFDDQACFAIAYHLAGALRVKSLSEFLIPVASNYSWSTIAAVKDRSCEVRLLEDVPSAKRIVPSSPVSDTDVQWVTNYFANYLGLASSEKFVLASEALTSQHIVHSERLKAASLWAGIEALFDVQSELRFRLSALIASVLEPRGTGRRAMWSCPGSVEGW